MSTWGEYQMKTNTRILHNARTSANFSRFKTCSVFCSARIKKTKKIENNLNHFFKCNEHRKRFINIEAPPNFFAAAIACLLSQRELNEHCRYLCSEWTFHLVVLHTFSYSLWMYTHSAVGFGWVELSWAAAAAAVQAVTVALYSPFRTHRTFTQCAHSTHSTKVL